MSLPDLPIDILFCIFDELPKEADRQCIRITCRKLYDKIQPAPTTSISTAPPQTITEAATESLRHMYLTAHDLFIKQTEQRIDIRRKAKHWEDELDQIDFLRRLFDDLSFEFKEGRKVCGTCRKISRFREGVFWNGDKGTHVFQCRYVKKECLNCGASHELPCPSREMRWTNNWGVTKSFKW